jgi:hypothetical protein
MLEPLVGIWWENGGKIAAFSHHPSDNSTNIAGRIDSNYAHVDLWPEAAKSLGCDPQAEYFFIPRGRVLINRRTNEGIILHGASTSQKSLIRIAKLFQLTKWTSEIDDHYAIGTDADTVFEDDAFN